jgi:hypothetical protein
MIGPRLITYMQDTTTYTGSGTAGSFTTLSTRHLAFTKVFASSTLRVTYFDVFGTVMSGSHESNGTQVAFWRVYLDGNATPIAYERGDNISGNGTEVATATITGYLGTVSAGNHTIDIVVEVPSGVSYLQSTKTGSTSVGSVAPGSIPAVIEIDEIPQ